MTRILISALILVLASPLAAAPPPQQANPQARDGELLAPRALAELLDLTDAQKAQIAALRETLRNTAEPLHEQLRANREQLDAAIEAGNAQLIGELVLAGRALREQLQAARQSFGSSFEALLTPDQAAKWAVYEEIRELRRGGDGPSS
jgi:Spy/CpxP family protein refolding chaperone